MCKVRPNIWYLAFKSEFFIVETGYPVKTLL